ncbi:MAG TPA: aminoacyl-tRNA hydrolase, partial [Thermomicrobiaceae bacterium]|nr:aminoacyl-tRNA hydrolase [Thermomicrobiaceae bacterium]
RDRFDGWLSEIREPDGRTILLKPKTFMNLSGNSVFPAARWYKVLPERILVIYDDLDLPFGSIRLRPSGSSAGHNGLQSIINRFGNQDIPRLRVGIGHGQTQSARSVAYVLSRFNRDETRHLDEVVALAAEAAICWRREGIDQAMNMYNGRKALPRAAETRHPTSTE